MSIRHLLTSDFTYYVRHLHFKGLLCFVSSKVLHLGRKLNVELLRSFYQGGWVHVVILKILVLCGEHNVLL